MSGAIRVHVRKQKCKGFIRLRYGRVPQVDGDYTIKELKEYNGKIVFSFSKMLSDEQIKSVMDRWGNKDIYTVTLEKDFYNCNKFGNWSRK